MFEVTQRVPCFQNEARPSPPPIHHPPELVLSTIKCLRDDCRGLQVCMLVCKAWYTFTRPLLYEFAAIHNEGVGVKDVMATIERTPEIAGWIKELRVSIPRSSRWIAYWPPEVDPLFDKLRNFQSLEFPGDTSLYKLHRFRAFASIRNLRFTHLTLSQIHLTNILVNLPLLSSLELDHCLVDNSLVVEDGFIHPLHLSPTRVSGVRISRGSQYPA